MGLSKANFQKRVHKKVSRRTIVSICKFLKKRELSLWGQNKWKHFLLDSIYLTLYKDLFNNGSIKLKEKVKQWYKPTTKSLHHNCQEIRREMSIWSETQVVIGDKEDWDRARDNSSFSKEFKSINLWMDSVDFGLNGRRKVSKKSLEWSYKLNRPGRRFMIVMDGSSQIRAKWGPYSPKTYDGFWLEEHRKNLENKFEGGSIAADTHFSFGRKLKKVKFFVPYSKQEKIYKLKKKYSKELRRIRSMVESPFGLIKQKFTSLDNSFAEGAEQLGYLVDYSIGIFNNEKN